MQETGEIAGSVTVGVNVRVGVKVTVEVRVIVGVLVTVAVKMLVAVAVDVGVRVKEAVGGTRVKVGVAIAPAKERAPAELAITTNTGPSSREITVVQARAGGMLAR
jgi:hypothetical protein